MTNWYDWFQESVNAAGDSVQASRYDSPRSFYVRQRAVLDWLGAVRGLQILDVGPATGHFCQPLTAQNTVIGVDFIPDMLKFAAQKGLLPTQGNGMHLPFASQSMDVVICVGVLQHIDDSAAFLRELLRVRKPNGQLYLETLNGESFVRRVYYTLPWNHAFMHTYTMPDLIRRFGVLAPGANIEAAAIYYPFPGYRRVGGKPGISRYLSTSLLIRVSG